MKHFISRRNFLKAAGVTAAASAMAAAVPQASAGFLTGKDAAVTILYTNDVHTYIDNKSPKLTYAAIAAMKQGYVDEGKPVLLVDAGDHIQGTAYGSMDDWPCRCPSARRRTASCRRHRPECRRCTWSAWRS